MTKNSNNFKVMGFFRFDFDSPRRFLLHLQPLAFWLRKTSLTLVLSAPLASKTPGSTGTESPDPRKLARWPNVKSATPVLDRTVDQPLNTTQSILLFGFEVQIYRTSLVWGVLSSPLEPVSDELLGCHRAMGCRFGCGLLERDSARHFPMAGCQSTQKCSS